ncbi:serum amyloid P-component-like [Vipera latastei]
MVHLPSLFLILVYLSGHFGQEENHASNTTEFHYLKGGFGPATRTRLHTQGHQHKRSRDQPVPPSSSKMVLLPSLLLILACLSGSFGQEDLQKKVFVFPAPSATSAVYLPISNQQPLTKLTVCLKHYTLLSRAYGLFSYATQSSDNDFLIFKSQANEYSIYVGGSTVNFKVPQKEKPSWDHICVSWDSSNGLVQFWLNGEPLPRQGLKKGYSLSQEASIILGQDQDSFGGGFDSAQSFVGEISDVNMWPRVLDLVGIRMVRNNIEPRDPLIYWRSLSYTIKDEVFVEDALSPPRCVHLRW